MSLGFLTDWAHQLPILLDGLRTSLALTVVSLLVGLPLSLAFALAVLSRRTAVRLPALAVVEFGRGVPALVMLQLVYFGLPQVKLSLESFAAAAVGLGYVSGAYMSEIVRAGLRAVPAGQFEAARASGLNLIDEYRYVVLPQALRIALPPLLGFAIVLFQATSLAFAVAVPELLSKAYAVGSATFGYLEVLSLAGIVYAAVVVPSAIGVRALERRLSRLST
ncbi:MAG TPA: amino acid ABC transporter permease [Micromonosporaceae bacterium]